MASRHLDPYIHPLHHNKAIMRSEDEEDDHFEDEDEDEDVRIEYVHGANGRRRCATTRATSEFWVDVFVNWVCC